MHPPSPLDPTFVPYIIHAQELEAKLQLPTEVGGMMKRYGEQYSALKTPRQLRWRPHQGVVGSPPCGMYCFTRLYCFTGSEA